MHRQRGQTMPLWTFGMLTVLSLLALSFNYGNMLMWQMRAQNAADAAAQGLLTVQTSEWNEEMAALHASAVEEYRLRFLVNDILQVVHGTGGCDTAALNGQTSCNSMYALLRNEYFDAVTRYTNDVTLLQRIATPGYSRQIPAMNAVLGAYQAACGTPKGGDCAFAYKLVHAESRSNDYLENVYSDANSSTVGGGSRSAPVEDLTPMQLEVITCAKVAPPLPHIFNFNAAPTTVVGRAAATSIMATQEFMYAGSLQNNLNGNAVFQPTEYPESPNNRAVFADNDPQYRIDFGGNPNDPYNLGSPFTAFSYGLFLGGGQQDQGLLVFTGWWTSLGIKPLPYAVHEGPDFRCKGP